jgi:hypothetical protein
MAPSSNPPAERQHRASDQPGDKLTDSLDSLQNILKLIGAVATALVPILLPPRLVPEQLEPIKVASSLLTLLFILLGWIYRPAVEKYLGRIVITALLAALTLIALNLAFVITLKLGSPPEPRYFLVGFAHSAHGERLLEKAGVKSKNRESQILEVGFDNIPTIYGTSFLANAATYSVATITMFGCTVLTLVGTVRPASNNSKNPAF